MSSHLYDLSLILGGAAIACLLIGALPGSKIPHWLIWVGLGLNVAQNVAYCLSDRGVRPIRRREGV